FLFKRTSLESLSVLVTLLISSNTELIHLQATTNDRQGTANVPTKLRR
ncbi:unnamed protein product, partial (mitochondrion) [Musa banksii]